MTVRNTQGLRISGKNLGTLARPDCCPRCFWLQHTTDKGLPYQIFPGIFSSIDAYTKNVVHGWFDRHGALPPWLAGLGEDITGYRNPPVAANFQILHEDTGTLLTGAPDGVFERADGSLLIVDYKTARFTPAQRGMFPVYETQLNAYAYIAEQTGYGQVSRLALVYTEPVTDSATLALDGIHDSGGVDLRFAPRIKWVTLDLATIPPLLAKARAILDQTVAPAARPGCRDCGRLDALNALLARRTDGEPA
jgi:hypothetical protein